MRAIFLGAVAATALCGAAFAQGQSSGESGGGGGRQQPPPMVTSPGGGGAGGGQQRMQGGADGPGGAGAAEQPRRSEPRQPDQGSQNPGPRQPAQGERTREDTGQPNRQPDRDATQGQREQGQQGRPGQAESNRQNRPSASGGADRTRINITSTQQKTVIKNNIVRTSVRVPAGVTIAVGTALPRTLVFHPVPAVILAEIPDLQPYLYIVIDDQVIFVEPDTYEIVYILAI